MSDEDIGCEGRDEVEEKYPDDDRHRIDARGTMDDRRDERLSWDNSSDFSSCEEEKSWDPDPEKEKERIGVGDEGTRMLEDWRVGGLEGWRIGGLEDWDSHSSIFPSFLTWSGILFFFTLFSLKGFCEDRQQGIQKNCSIHHPDFHDLHREGIEGDHTIGDVGWFHDREENSIHLEKYHIQKECESIGNGSDKDMSDIGSIPAKMYRMPAIRIPPCESRHDEITSESCDHHESESLSMGLPPHESREDYDHPESHEFSYRICDDRELGLQDRLKIAHQRAIDESEEGKKWCNPDSDEGFSRIVSVKKVSYREWKNEYETPRKCSQGEDIRCYGIDHFWIVFVCWEFSDGDRVESEICDHSKYREKVIDLWIESISFDIEIPSENLDHADRDYGSEDFACDLGKGVGIDFSSRHRVDY